MIDRARIVSATSDGIVTFEVSVAEYIRQASAPIRPNDYAFDNTMTAEALALLFRPAVDAERCE